MTRRELPELKPVWFRNYGELYRLAYYSRYGMNWRIRAIGIDGELWDVLGDLFDVDERMTDEQSAALDMVHPSIVEKCKKISYTLEGTR